MANNRTRHFAEVPRWRFALSLASHHHFRDEYFVSQWYDWESRIKGGHDSETKKLDEFYKEESKNILSDDPYFAESLGEDYGRIDHLTNNMYAALIVSIWSEMESFLKDLVGVCYRARGVKKRVPYDIKNIKEEIEKGTGIQVNSCRNYIIVDAIRILNNSYKHSWGYYRPQALKPDTQIDRSLLKKWRIEEGVAITYRKLPLEKIFLSFRAFCDDALKKVEHALKTKEKDDSAKSKNHESF